MEERILNRPDPIIHCDCGHSVPQSEMVNAFMGANIPRNVCDECYDAWLEDDKEKEETLSEVLENAFKNQ